MHGHKGSPRKKGVKLGSCPNNGADLIPGFYWNLQNQTKKGQKHTEKISKNVDVAKWKVQKKKKNMFQFGRTPPTPPKWFFFCDQKKKKKKKENFWKKNGKKFWKKIFEKKLKKKKKKKKKFSTIKL